MADRLAPSQRHQFVHQGQVVYEWDQTFSEVNIYVQVPPGVKGKQLFVDLAGSHVRFGIKPNPPFLDVGGGRAWVLSGEVPRCACGPAHMPDMQCLHAHVLCVSWSTHCW